MVCTTRCTISVWFHSIWSMCVTVCVCLSLSVYMCSALNDNGCMTVVWFYLLCIYVGWEERAAWSQTQYVCICLCVVVVFVCLPVQIHTHKHNKHHTHHTVTHHTHTQSVKKPRRSLIHRDPLDSDSPLSSTLPFQGVSSYNSWDHELCVMWLYIIFWMLTGVVFCVVLIIFATRINLDGKQVCVC